jgi:hypothetical protein
MSVLGTYLWKEWRDHRPVVLAMLVAVPLLDAIAAWSLPSRLFAGPGFAALSGIASLAIAFFALSDLAPGEKRRDHLRFLARMPAGVLTAFRGKAAFFAVVLAGAVSWGWLGGAVASWCAAGVWPAVAVEPLIPGALAVVLAWAFALSCALPRGILGLPAAVFLFGLLAAPLVPWIEKIDLHPDDWWFGRGALALWCGGAMVAGALAFGRRRSLGRCVAVALVCAAPFLADAAMRVHAWEEPPWEAYLSVVADEDGLLAHCYRTRFHRTREYELRGVFEVDAATGAVRPATGRTVAHARRMRLPGGRVVLWRGGKLVVDGEIVGGAPWAAVRGTGVELQRMAYYDPARGRLYRRRDLDLDGRNVWVRPGLWLVGKRSRYELFDPDAKTYTPALGLGDERPVAVLEDGRVLVNRRDGVRLVDPETGDEVAPGLPEDVRAVIAEDQGALRGVSKHDGYVRYLRWTGDRFVGTARFAHSGLCYDAGDTLYVSDSRRLVRLRFGSDAVETILTAAGE